MESSLSIFARALATENLSFSFDANAETASFDVKNRHLTMPMWDVSETVQTMLVAHEISHALWTPYAKSEELLAVAEKQGYNKVVLQRIANVLEDVRIEKLMKAKYPGTRRDFFLGYKEIMDRDMFHLKTIDLNRASLVQRINIYFKFALPGFIDLSTSAEDDRIIAAVDRITEFDQVFAVAKMLYDHPEMKDEVQKAIDQLGKGMESKPETASDGIPGNTFDGIGKKEGTNYSHGVVTIDPISNLPQQIISSSSLLSNFDKRVALSYSHPLNLEEYRKFVRESDAFVRQLASQFERRKAADEIRRERPKQTGMLNLDRLHQYRTHDDIFLSKIIKQDGKNHGIVFMLDCSGSMQTTIGDCFLQVLQLVWFCDKVKIPYEFFGFTDCYHPDYQQQQKDAFDAYVAANPEDPMGEGFRYQRDPKSMNPVPTSLAYNGVKLIQFATSTDSPEDRERLLAYLYSVYVKGDRAPVTSLGGTPTVEAIALTSQFMVDWVKANNIQIPTLMVVTDGAPNGIHVIDHEVANLCYRSSDSTMLTVHNRILNTMHRFDGAAHSGLDLSNAIISTMLDGLREKLNLRSVGMFVGPKTFNSNMFAAYCISRKEEQEFCRARNYSPHYEGSPRYNKAKEQYADGAIVLPDSTYPGFDAFFLIKTPKIVKDEDAIAESGSFARVKNTFIRTMGKRSTSRVFLTRYVDIVAGQPIKGVGEGLYVLSPIPLA